MATSLGSGNNGLGYVSSAGVLTKLPQQGAADDDVVLELGKLYIELGDAAGADTFRVRDSAAATVLDVGSSGVVDIGKAGALTTIKGSLTVDQDLIISGTTTTFNTATLSVEDPLIILANGNSAADVVDIGFYGLYDPTNSQDVYTGLFRDASDGIWKFFELNQAAPTTTVNVGGTGYDHADVQLGALTVDDAATIGSTLGVTGASTFTGAAYANGGLDRSTAAALAIGATNASAVDISKSGTATTIKGTFNVDEAATFDTTVGITGTLTAAAINASGNIAQSGATTFSTGTGAVSINGETTMAAGKDLLAASTGCDIGTSGARWGTAYITTLNATTATISGTTGETFIVNSDATTTADSPPIALFIKNGDGTDVVRAQFGLVASSNAISFAVHSDTAGNGTFTADRPTNFLIGDPTITSDNDSSLVLYSGNGSTTRYVSVTMVHADAANAGLTFAFDSAPAAGAQGFGYTLVASAAAAASGATASDIGGGFSLTGGVGGAASTTGGGTAGAGGAFAMTLGAGGAGAATTNLSGAAGGAYTVTSGAGGQAGAAGGTGGTGGAVTLTAGAGGAANGGTQGNGGAVSITSGAGLTAGAVAIDSGSGTTGGAITIGGTNAASVSVGRSAITTTIPGALAAEKGVTVTGAAFSISTGSSFSQTVGTYTYNVVGSAYAVDALTVSIEAANGQASGIVLGQTGGTAFITCDMSGDTVEFGVDANFDDNLVLEFGTDSDVLIKFDAASTADLQITGITGVGQSGGVGTHGVGYDLVSGAGAAAVANTNTGGLGGDYTVALGTGGVAAAGTTGQQKAAGIGGSFSFTAGAGGAGVGTATGGQSAGASAAGGTASITGGTGGAADVNTTASAAASAGGVATLQGGVGGIGESHATASAEAGARGGEARVLGGVGGAGDAAATNKANGGQGGQLSLDGGVGGASGGAGSTAGAGGGLVMTGGAAGAAGAGTGANGGAVTIRGGAATGAGTNGAVSIGATNTASIGIGASGITTTVTGGLTQLTGAVSLTGNAASSFTTSSGALTLTSAATCTWSATGDLNLTATADVDIDGATVNINSTGTCKIGDDVATLDFDGAGAVNETGMTSFSITPSGAITLTAGGASTWSTSSGALTLTSAAAATWSTSSGALTLTSAAAVNINATGDADLSGVTGAVICPTTFTSGAAYSAGDVVTLNSAAKLVKADANDHAIIVGIALTASTGADETSKKIYSMPGQIVTGPATTGMTVGNIVYLSETGGAITETAPTTAGSRIIRVGIVHTVGAAGSGKIIFAPQFIATN